MPKLRTVEIRQITIMNQDAAALEEIAPSILQDVKLMKQIRCVDIIPRNFP